MSEISRRDFARLAGAAGIGTWAASAWAPFAIAQGAAKVVIVGGGAGGATVAHYVKKGAPELDVTLIEANPIYSSSFFSNLYIGGFRTLESLKSAVANILRKETGAEPNLQRLLEDGYENLRACLPAGT